MTASHHSPLPSVLQTGLVRRPVSARQQDCGLQTAAVTTAVPLSVTLAIISADPTAFK